MMSQPNASLPMVYGANGPIVNSSPPLPPDSTNPSTGRHRRNELFGNEFDIPRELIFSPQPTSPRQGSPHTLPGQIDEVMQTQQSTPLSSRGSLGSATSSLRVSEHSSPLSPLSPLSPPRGLSSGPSITSAPLAPCSVSVAEAEGPDQIVEEKIAASKSTVLLDPIDQKAIHLPVIGPNGVTHSKETLLKYLRKNSHRLPNTEMTISPSDIFENYAIQTRIDLINEFGEKHDASQYLTCPITLQYFKHPVVASDGHTYEHNALKLVMGTTMRSPITRESLTSNVYFNRAIAELLKIEVTVGIPAHWPPQPRSPSNTGPVMPMQNGAAVLESGRAQNLGQPRSRPNAEAPLTRVRIGALIGSVAGIATIASLAAISPQLAGLILFLLLFNAVVAGGLLGGLLASIEITGNRAP